MDPVSITPLAISAWTLIAPYAKKLAGKLAEKASDALPDVLGTLWDAVKAKMEAHPETDTLPAELIAAPDDQIVQGAFQYQLKKLLESDALFAQQIEKLIKEANEHTLSISATLDGDGAIAQGTGATALGNGAVSIQGNAANNMIITGDENIVNSRKKKRNTKK